MTSERPEFGQPLPKAQPKRRAKAASAHPPDEDRVDDYRHQEATRLNIPEAGIATQDRTAIDKVTYAYDPHLDPQLVWAGKSEHTSFEIDTVSLHIHERVSTEAMMRAIRREQVQRTLFADPQLSPAQELDFYQHDTDWANRLILGDSLLVMNSLIRREGMAGKVQSIYIDPPYGVNYNSNFQPRTDQRDVRDDDKSITREPEQIRAYRDTWQLGIHSYLTYLRDRLLLARDLLTDSGSVFVQISDENVHRVRAVLDEVFGAENECPTIVVQKTSGQSSPTGRTNVIASVADYILWYARDATQQKFRRLYNRRAAGAEGSQYTWVELQDGSRRRMSREEQADPTTLPRGARPYHLGDITSQSFQKNTTVPYQFADTTFHPGSNRHWTTTVEGLDRLAAQGRLAVSGNTLRYIRYFDDFAYFPMSNVWSDTGVGGFTEPKVYVVQTNTKIVTRCLLMTTDPGDLVFDPTCGSGTTAYVAEQWGRRWITCDTSRVALALARQRLMTASYDYYQLADTERGVDAGFVNEVAERRTLRTVAYREPPETETLYDQPLIDRRRTRVAGPFTVEQIPSFGIEVSDGRYDPAALNESDRSDDVRHRSEENPVRTIGELVELLRIDGVRLPAGRHLQFSSLAQTAGGGEIHAEGEYDEAGESRRIAVSFGPLHGPISARQVEEVLRDVVFQPYHAVLFAGFAFDAGAQQYIQNYRAPKNLQLLMANIAADVLVPDLLKNRRGQQLFAVFGEPDATLARSGADFTVELLGMDVYDPTTGDVSSSGTDGVAAWFLDTDYDRRSFLISQAFFPGAGATDPWARLGRALRGWVDPDAFDMLRGTTSLPFTRGPEGRIAVKVIDFRGNEAIKILELPEA
jgi:adenine-specific DNA-methyltransferase